jgi:hypothetical protein
MRTYSIVVHSNVCSLEHLQDTDYKFFLFFNGRSSPAISTLLEGRSELGRSAPPRRALLDDRSSPPRIALLDFLLLVLRRARFVSPSGNDARSKYAGANSSSLLKRISPWYTGSSQRKSKGNIPLRPDLRDCPNVRSCRKHELIEEYPLRLRLQST